MRTEVVGSAVKHTNKHRSKIEESIERAFNAVLSKDLSPSRLRRAEPPEARLVYAMAYHYLKEKHPDLAEKMLHTVPKKRVKLRDAGEKAPIFKATDSFIQRLVSSGKLSKSEGDKILCYAIGKGNFVGGNGELSTSRVKLDPGSSNLDSIIEKIRTNRPASIEELSAARLSVDGKAKAAAANEEAFAPGKVPSPEDEPEMPGDLTFRPRGYEKFGFGGIPTLRLPSHYNEEVDSVGVFNDAGELIGEMSYKGKIGSNSLFAMENHSTPLGKNLSLKLHLIDGSVVSIELPDGKSFYKRSYYS